MTRRVSVSTYYWIDDWARQQTEVFAMTKDIGFDGIEISLYAQPDIDPAHMKREAESCGLEILVSTGVPAHADPSSPDPAIRAASVDYLTSCLQATFDMGSTLLGGLTYSPWMLFPPDADPVVGREMVVDSLGQVAVAAQDLGVTLCIEPVNRFETYVLNTAAQAAEVVDAIGSERVAVQMDAFHMNMEERSPADSIRALGRRLGHMQVADNDRSVPGVGSIDFGQIGTALDDIGYEGWIGLETFPHPGTGVGNDTFTWRPLVNDLRADAVAGLAVIHDLLCGAT